jgi:sulfopyruvate decarboxylase TPP-binding subunit
MHVGVPYTGCLYKSEVPVTREDEAIAFAVGVALGGGECQVYMQNDGLGQCVNIICTLLKPYDIKIPMEIKVRHSPEHHAYMGKITPELLRLLGYAESNKRNNGQSN